MPTSTRPEEKSQSSACAVETCRSQSTSIMRATFMPCSLASVGVMLSLKKPLKTRLFRGPPPTATMRSGVLARAGLNCPTFHVPGGRGSSV